MQRELRLPQQLISSAIVEKFEQNKNINVWAGMGTGKTAATMIALDTLDLFGVEVFPVLVLATLRVAKNVWSEEITQWPQYLGHRTVSAIVGDQRQRTAALQREADFYTINYENLEWLVEMVTERGFQWRFKTTVADESTKLRGLRVYITNKQNVKGQGGVRSKALSQMIVRYPTRHINLTGTPSPNGLVNLWGQNFFIDRGLRLGRCFDAFSKRWFIYDREGKQLIPQSYAQRQIETAIADVSITIDPKDYYDLKEPIVNDIYVDLDKPTRKHYREMEKDFYTEIRDTGVDAVSAGVKSMKLSQLANGFIYENSDDPDEKVKRWIDVHDAKLDALADIIDEANGMPVLVGYWFKPDLEKLKKRFPEGRVLDDKKSTENDFNAGKIPILFAQYMSAAHGINLQHGTNIIALYSMTWDLELYDQLIGRIGPVRQMQSGYDRPVYIHRIMARRTTDEIMRDRIASKRSVQDLLMEAMKKFFETP